jgi:hypothetical protein
MNEFSLLKHTRRQFGASLLAPLAVARSGAAVVFSCTARNDVYRALSTAQATLPRYNTPELAIAQAPPGAGVLLLADGYPDTRVPFSDGLASEARKKRLRVFVEYADRRGNAGPTKTADKERAVVPSSFFGSALPPMSILSLHACRFLPLPQPDAKARTHLMLAKVAGFDNAVFGLPQDNVYPLLIETEPDRVLLATTQLSRFITARYGPAAAWPIVWRRILEWLSESKLNIEWQPTVHPAWPPSARLPLDVEKSAAVEGAGWYFGARLFVHSSWAHKLHDARSYEDRVGPAPTAAMPVGDGSLGMIEGHSSRIEFDGSQPARWWIRADCVGETSMVLTLTRRLSARSHYQQVAQNLLDFLLLRSKMATGAKLDPANPAYGLIGWNEATKYFKDEDGFDVYYGDDNARCLLGALAATAMTGEPRWQRRIWLAVLANFRLIGTLGFQKFRYDQAPLLKDGWQHYHNSPIVLHDMNYQAYPWALFLWAYSHTKFQPFFDRCEHGIRMSFEAYPNKWRWSNSITSQQARFLLPLAWLVRVKNTEETRSWLRKIAEELLSHQHESGAIYEWTGPSGTGIQTPPTSNAKYGTAEGTLIQNDGDPAADLLYTMNFAFIGLHEAYAATGDPFYKQAEDRIAQFLVRVQAHSTVHPQFHGAWYRAFDFKTWEYWASNSDAGWGAWCTESGWSQSWISATLALRVLGESLWEVLQKVPAFDEFQELSRQMFAGSTSRV